MTISKGGATYANSQRGAPALGGAIVGYLADQDLNPPAQNASTGLRVAGRRFAHMTMIELRAFCQTPELHRIAARAKPDPEPVPAEHRALPYKAASLYADDCTTFANFVTPP